MELIWQRTKTDCGVACVAMVAGVTYEEAEAAFDFPKRQRHRRTDMWDVYRALRKLGKKPEKRLVPGPANGTNAVLKCNRGRRRTVVNVRRWHWCVWDSAQQRVLDPAGNGGVPRPVLSHMPVRNC